jgi:hypothetical protein
MPWKRDPAEAQDVEAHMPFRKRNEDAEAATDGSEREPVQPDDADDDVEAHRRRFH